MVVFLLILISSEFSGSVEILYENQREEIGLSRKNPPPSLFVAFPGMSKFETSSICLEFQCDSDLFYMAKSHIEQGSYV